MKKAAKKVSESTTTMTELVLPNDTNPLQNLRGGRLLHWMDIAAAIAAQKHCNSITVTAGVDNVSFENPIHIGNVVTIHAEITRSFNTSMEVFIKVYAEDIPEGTKKLCNEAYYTFVGLTKEGKPLKVPAVIPETSDQEARYESAMRRRELRLVLAGRMKPSDAKELKSLFD